MFQNNVNFKSKKTLELHEKRNERNDSFKSELKYIESKNSTHYNLNNLFFQNNNERKNLSSEDTGLPIPLNKPF